MSIQTRRIAKGWSQEELALHSGISVRTIQRIEAGRKAGLETLKCLAAVFETTVIELIKEQDMNTDTIQKSAGDMPATPEMATTNTERDAIEYVQNLKAFHLHWISFVFVIPALYILNSLISPDVMWVYWVGAIWAGALALHLITLFGLFGVFGAGWEQKQFRRRMMMKNR
jgi:transcriptional regulator with XRE-family HTH domain